MRLVQVLVPVLLVVVALPAWAQASIPQSISESVGRTLRSTEGQFLALAEAMPEQHYGFVPRQGAFAEARSFGEQVQHVACGHFAFFNQIEGKTPPPGCAQGGPKKLKGKAEIVQYLRDSIAYADKVLTTISAENALDRVEGPYAGPNTRLGMAVTAVWHLSDHYGQLVVYLRLNGIAPPATQAHPLKVR